MLYGCELANIIMRLQFKICKMMQIQKLTGTLAHALSTARCRKIWVMWSFELQTMVAGVKSGSKKAQDEKSLYIVSSAGLMHGVLASQ